MGIVDGGGFVAWNNEYFFCMPEHKDAQDAATSQSARGFYCTTPRCRTEDDAIRSCQGWGGGANEGWCVRRERREKRVRGESSQKKEGEASSCPGCARVCVWQSAPRDSSRGAVLNSKQYCLSGGLANKIQSTQPRARPVHTKNTPTLSFFFLLTVPIPSHSLIPSPNPPPPHPPGEVKGEGKRTREVRVGPVVSPLPHPPLSSPLPIPPLTPPSHYLPPPSPFRRSLPLGCGGMRVWVCFNGAGRRRRGGTPSPGTEG